MTPQQQLEELALNLRWAWHVPTRDFFSDLDPGLWERVRYNPRALARRLDPGRLEDPAVQRELAGRLDALRAYLEDENLWYDEQEEPADRPLTAYFSAEFGIAECLRIYSGGLGVLAGDHLKSASDLGVPLVGIGILYREGYFQQSLGPGARQAESYEAVDFDDVPLREVPRADGTPLRVAVPLPGRRVYLRVWRAEVGRVPLFLLDADVPENRAEDRSLTARLYGGDQETRIAQEILLGIGGYRALREMEISPRSYHMNEGHSAFLGLELLRESMEAEGAGLDAAVEATRRRCIFTTHTPVPDGHDRFTPELMELYFTGVARSMGLAFDELLALGREDPDDDDEAFTMTILAIRLAGAVNGVSRLHGAVSREMWQPLWPERDLAAVPIGHITNGVHLPSWVRPEVGALYGMEPSRVGVEPTALPRPDPEQLWAVHQGLRGRLVDTIAERTGARLDRETLTIVFARRFATYKRATLILGDLDRLEALVNDAHRPVQLVFSGKAHPRDEGGKALIRQIAELAGTPAFRDRVIFLPGYEMDTARRLVQGADVWLNNPRRPLEASGTSGMKAAANGVLNVSILDGWWDEAWELASAEAAAIGWAVGHGREALDEEEGDRADRRDLLRILETEVVPAFYDRDAAGLPRRWMAMMADAVRVVAPFFNSNRMVREYVDRYAAAADRPVGTV